jgi:oxalate decarboxylase/phosphoglucose isomerase-like protein (cupin superfamily)
MSDLEKVTLIPRTVRVDVRGWLLKVVDGSEAHLPPGVGEVYLVVAMPGEVRGNHYHPETSEWFTVISGTAILLLGSPSGEERSRLVLTGTAPTTVYVPCGIAHAFQNPEEAAEPIWVIAYADRQYDPGDTIPFPLVG